MGDTDERQQRGGRAGRGLGLCCALVFLLVVTHIALMTTERHTEVMGPLMGASALPGTASMLAAKGLGHRDTGGERVPQPRPVLGDCPAQEAILPFLLLSLLLLSSLLGRHSTVPGSADLMSSWDGYLSLPPPLAPSRRRALLQVFQN